MVAITNETYINALSVCDLTVKIASQYQGNKVTLVMDNARYQRCQLVKDKDKELWLALLYLPSYSPNLNLIERVWKFVKKQLRQGKYCTTFADFRQKIQDCVDQLATTHRAHRETLVTRNFEFFDKERFLPH